MGHEAMPPWQQGLLIRWEDKKTSTLQCDLFLANPNKLDIVKLGDTSALQCLTTTQDV
jgi:hypothetical protein